MTYLRSDYEQCTLFSLAMLGRTGVNTDNYATDVHFDDIGCLDLFKEVQKELNPWAFEEVGPARECSSKDEIKELFGQTEVNEESTLFYVSNIIPPEIHENLIEKCNQETLEEFVASEYQNQMKDAKISQPQQISPDQTTKSCSAETLVSSSPVANKLLLDSPLSILSSDFSQSIPITSLSNTALQTSAMSFQLGAIDALEDLTETHSDADNLNLNSEFPDTDFIAPHVESDLSLELFEKENSNGYDNTFTTELNFSQFMFELDSTEARAISKDQSKNKQVSHVHFAEMVEYNGPNVGDDDIYSHLEPFFDESFDYNNSLQGFIQEPGPKLEMIAAKQNHVTTTITNPLFAFNKNYVSAQDTSVSPQFLTTIPRVFPAISNLPDSLKHLPSSDSDHCKSNSGISDTGLDEISFGFTELSPTRMELPAHHESQFRQHAAQHNFKDKFRVSKPERPRRTKRIKRKFDYSLVKVDNVVVKVPQLQNNAKNPPLNVHNYQNKLILLLHQSGCVINRTRYHRGNIDNLYDLHPNVFYEKNPFFGPNHPYQQEFTRVELDPVTLTPIMETRSALCAYCEEISFYELKNSCYSQHMSHSHGIYTDDYLTPDPLLIGRYQVSKKPNAARKTRPRNRCHEGVVCPACYDIVEIRCWTSTLKKKPLSNYLRHFKENHRVDKRRETFFNLHS